MILTAWNNGDHHTTGAGYGFRVDLKDRALYFNPEQRAVHLEFAVLAPNHAEVNIDKLSFWSPTCHELINHEIGKWLIANGYAWWPKSSPPKFTAVQTAPGHILVLGPPIQHLG